MKFIASDCRKIERIQERALRAIYKTKGETYETLLNWSGLPTLLNRRLQDIAIYMYKVKHDLAPSIISELFTAKHKQHLLRNADFNIPRYDTLKYGKHTLRYLGPVLWSKLNRDIKSKTTLKSFKKCIRKIDIANILDNNVNCCELCTM